MADFEKLKEDTGTILEADSDFMYLFSTNFGYNSWQKNNKVKAAANSYYGDAYHMAEVIVNPSCFDNYVSAETCAKYIKFLLFFQAGLCKMFSQNKDHKFNAGDTQLSLNDIGDKYCIMYNQSLKFITFKL